MTFRRRSAAVNGCEFSHAIAPSKEGNSPSLGDRPGAVGCTFILGWLKGWGLLDCALAELVMPIWVATIMAAMTREPRRLRRWRLFSSHIGVSPIRTSLSRQNGQ